MSKLRLRNCLVWCGILFTLFNCPIPAAAKDLLPGWLERYTSRFNPVGALLLPLENKIPGLTVKGFLRNYTDWNLHADSGDVGLGHGTKDWDAQQIKWLTELEVRYQINDHLEIVNIDNFLYDAFYDWQKTGSLANHIERDAEYYHETKRILREIYLAANYQNWEIILGKQQLVWGKMDGKFIDIINPEDAREGPQHELDDYEWTRIPLWMLNIAYNWSNSYLNFIWIPDFEPSRSSIYTSAYWPPDIKIYPETLSPYPPSVRLMTRDKPPSSFPNHEVGLRYNFTRGAWDTSLIYFYTWDDLPTSFFRSGTIDPISQTPSSIWVEPKHTRLHQLGLASDISYYALNRDWVGRIEAVYTLNKYIPLKPIPGIYPWLAGQGNVTKRNTLKSAISIETTIFKGDVTLLFQPVFNYVFGYDNNMNARHEEILFIWNIRQAIHYYDDRLKYNLTWYYFPWSQMNGWKYKFDIWYEISDYLNFRIRYTGYSGHQDEAYGMYDDWDNLGIEFVYAF